MEKPLEEKSKFDCGLSADPEELLSRAAAKTADRAIESWNHLRVENTSKVLESNCHINHNCSRGEEEDSLIHFV